MIWLLPQAEIAKRLVIVATIAAIGAVVAWPLCKRATAQSAPPSPTAPALLDNMDDAAPALKLLDGAANVRLLSQSIERGRSRCGVASERLALSIPAGSSAPLAYDLPPAIVIRELRLAAWVSCNRPGAQLAATVVLPRTIDPQTGEPRRLLVRSGKPGAGGDWELLTFDNLDRELPAHARVTRAKYGGSIDERGAYVSQLVILAPGGPGTTDVWVDQISLHGVLIPAETTVAAMPSGVALATAESPAPAAPKPAAVAPPPVPRIIQWQGEPLEELQKIGFDAVWMGRPPVAAELAEASRLGMFIVCQPPSVDQLPGHPLDERYAQVMAWDLGQLAQPAELDLTHRWAQMIERQETDAARPVLLRPLGMTREASRIADLVMLGRPTFGSTQSWPDYGAWLGQQRRFVRLGTPIWVKIDTHSGRPLTAQLTALRGAPTPAIIPTTFRELALTTTAAFGAMPRGFCFQSETSLAGGEPENHLRALALELNNLRLGMAEPWLAAGKAATAAHTSQRDLSGLVLKVERSHLIIPLRWRDGAAAPVDRPGGQPITFHLPGVPESSDAYLLSIAGSQRLPAVRETGGLKITVDRLPDDAFLLVTEDGYAYSHIERYLRQHAPRAAKSRIELAALRRQQAVDALSKLPPGALGTLDPKQELAPVEAQLTAVIETMRRRDFGAAFACAAEAERLLDQSLHRVVAIVAPSLPAGTSPIPLDWTTLSELARLEAAVSRSQAESQSLPGGEFEDLEQLLQAGWQRLQNPPPGIETAVRLSPEAPARGGFCLEIDARSAGSPGHPPSLPTPPVWVTSPPLAVPPGHLVEITGMARLGEAILGSPDPLLIFDSVGGEESAMRISLSPSWTPFRLVRAVPPGAELRVTIALGGIGRAQVDSLMYRYLPLDPQSLAQAPRQ